jgi:hypothetical protein
LTDAQATLLEANASDMQTKHPELFGTTVVRDITGGKVIEQIVLRELQPATQPIEGLSTKSVKLGTGTQPIQSVQWIFTAIIPSGTDFTAYDLSVGMPLGQYKGDEAFLRSIFETLKYNPVSASAPIH